MKFFLQRQEIKVQIKIIVIRMVFIPVLLQVKKSTTVFLFVVVFIIVICLSFQQKKHDAKQ